MSNENNDLEHGLDDELDFEKFDSEITDDIEITDEITDDIEITDEITDDIEIIDDKNNEKSEETEFEIMFKNTANKHKQEGAHSLNRDTIFLGKKEIEEEGLESSTEFFDNTYELEKGSSYEYETHRNDEYIHNKNLMKDIYDILDKKTDVDFLMNRRKPDKKKFNLYYELCLSELSLKYTKSEIFVELSYYFTDSIFNMFKLLNKKNASGIIIELKEKGYLNSIGNINFI